MIKRVAGSRVAQDTHPPSLPLAPHGGSGHTRPRGGGPVCLFPSSRGHHRSERLESPEPVPGAGLGERTPVQNLGLPPGCEERSSPGFLASGLLNSGPDRSLSRGPFCAPQGAQQHLWPPLTRSRGRRQDTPVPCHTGLRRAAGRGSLLPPKHLTPGPSCLLGPSLRGTLHHLCHFPPARPSAAQSDRGPCGSVVPFRSLAPTPLQATPFPTPHFQPVLLEHRKHRTAAAPRSPCMPLCLCTRCSPA